MSWTRVKWKKCQTIAEIGTSFGAKFLSSTLPTAEQEMVQFHTKNTSESLNGGSNLTTLKGEYHFFFDNFTFLFFEADFFFLV